MEFLFGGTWIFWATLIFLSSNIEEIPKEKKIENQTNGFVRNANNLLIIKNMVQRNKKAGMKPAFGI